MKNNALAAILAVVIMLASSVAVINLGDSSDAAVYGTPAGHDYGFVLTLSDSSTIESVEYSAVPSAAAWETLTTKTSVETAYSAISKALQFDAVTGVGPFNTYYAAMNIADTSSVDTSLTGKISSVAGRVAFVLDPYDLSKTINGDEFTASAYNVMLIIPTVYWFSDETHLFLTNNPYFFDAGKYAVAASNFDAYAHTVNGTVRSWIGIGVYEGSFLDDTTNNTTAQGTYDEDAVLVSQSGKTPARWQNIAQFRTQANNLNTGISSGEYMLWNFYQWTLTKMMDYTVMGTKNSQGAVGNGVSGGSGPAVTGLIDDQAPFWGTSENSTTSSKLFIENSIGSVWEFVDDTWFSDRVLQVGQNSIATLIENDTDYSLNSTNQSAVPDAVLPATGWETSEATDPSYWDLPLAGSATEGDSADDDSEWSNTGSRCFFVGGYWTDGARAGVASANANNALSNANDNVGSRLTKTSEITLGTDLALRQNISTNHNPSIGRTVPKTGARLSYGVIL